MKKIISLVVCMPLIASVLLGLSSCEHKDLCYHHEEHALKYHALVEATYELEWQKTMAGARNWESEWPTNFGMGYDDLRPVVPKGLRALVYNEDKSHDMVNLPAKGGVLNMSMGEHSILFYNNDTEYIIFDELQSSASAKATTRTRSRSSYLGNSFSGTRNENTVTPPDMLYGNYVPTYTPIKQISPELLPITMHPLVFTYLIRYEFSAGYEYVALSRGALAGMAGSVYLFDGHTSENAVTLLYDCTLETFGPQAIVQSFGIPNYPNPDYTRGNQKYALNLEVKLKNGKIKNFDFDVTDQVEKQPNGGVIVVKGIEISDKEGQEGGSGFDVDVEGWGDYQDVELPL